MTLNEDRALQSPALCWTSGAKGEEPSVRQLCPENQLRIAGWGRNSRGELGLGTNVPVSAATSMPGGGLAGLTFAGISSSGAGSITNCAILTADAYCWGQGAYGNLGTGGTLYYSTVPVAVDDSGVLAGRDVTQIETGFYATCALADGAPFCWGDHDDDNIWSSVPFAIDTTGVLAGKTITDIAVHQTGACVIADFAPYCWGTNDLGVRGDGTPDSWTWESSPVAVDTTGVLAGKDVSDIVAGSSTVCVIAEYRAYCWGDNWDGQLGIGSSEDYSLVPVAVSGPLAGLNVTSLSANHSMCAVAEGDAYCWGYGGQGQLGTGVSYTLSGTGSRELLPRKVDDTGVISGKTVTHVDTGNAHGCVLADGQPFCWGRNSYKQLGTSIAANAVASSPVAINTVGTPLDGVYGVDLTVSGWSTLIAYPK